MAVSEQDWNDIIVKEIDSKMTNMVERGYFMPETEKQRMRLKFSKVLEDIFEMRFREMNPYDMDYCHMQNLLNLIKTRQWKKICPYVEKVNETYFREYFQHLMKNAEEDKQPPVDALRASPRPILSRPLIRMVDHLPSVDHHREYPIEKCRSKCTSRRNRPSRETYFKS